MGYGRVTLTFGDGEHDFELRIGDLKELKEKTGLGPMALYNRMRAGDWDPQHNYEIVRIGMIGAGTPPLHALDFARRYAAERPWIEAAHPAFEILTAALFGPEDDVTPKKDEAPKAETT